MSATNAPAIANLDASPVRGGIARPRRRLRARLRMPLMLLGVVAVAVGGLYFYASAGRYVGTDDSYVQAGRVSISTDISARVVAIDVVDNQVVHAGDELFRLDSRSFDIAIENARARLASARLQVDATKAVYRQRQADLKAAQDTVAYQQQEYNRQKRLLGSGIASQATFDQVSHALDNARQQVDAAQQQIASVLADLGGNPDIELDKHPSVQQAQAELDRALLNRSFTIITAPEDGIVTKVDQLQVGDFVNAATPVFSLISNKHVWIEANFKETDLTHMHVGQTATVEIDTYPDAALTAKVTSISPGTGSSFALLPPENATGNWVKVVQRLPVRMTLDAAPADAPLRAGMSATVPVDTHHERAVMTFLRRILGLEPTRQDPARS